MSDALADLSTVGAGFADPVTAAQSVYRLALDAFAHPGRVVLLPGDLSLNESGLSEASAALALTLLDFETPVWLDSDAKRASGFLRFHCGAPLAASPRDCRFAFVADVAACPTPDSFDLGSEDYPDRSTTLVVEVTELRAGEGRMLRGPGILDHARLHAAGLPAGFWAARAALASLFPRGLDVIFTCGRAIAAIPRTTIVGI